uniref:Uncharacterized protein n=1 Tax=Astyanax mexicanus TaxID=7994 RepID=A0A3B1J3M6_ASTMX
LSNTTIVISQLTGSPPSVAVNINVNRSCFSLSRGLCKTISTFLRPSALFCSSKTKLSVG